MKKFVFLLFLILCFFGILDQAFCSGTAWYRQPPYRYYWKQQRRYQQYQYNQQKLYAEQQNQLEEEQAPPEQETGEGKKKPSNPIETDIKQTNASEPFGGKDNEKRKVKSSLYKEGLFP